MMKEKAAPCMTEAAIRCCQTILSVAIATPTSKASVAAAACPTWITLLRSTRSATAPPNRDSARIGSDELALTIPSSDAEPVKSYTR